MPNTNLAELAGDHGLTRMGTRAPLHRYLAETWRRRHFAFAMARFRSQAGTSRTRLGSIWIVARPIMMALVFGLVFGVIMPPGTRPPNFLPFLFVGVFLFEYFARSLQEGAKSITTSGNLVRSLNFPRILLPLSVVARGLYELVPVMGMMLIILIILGEYPRWSWFMLIPILALMTVFNLGVALISARLTVHVRDVTQLLPFVARVLFYSSGIFYSLERIFARQPDMLALARLNPVHDFIALARAYTITGFEALPILWIVCGVASALVFLGGVVFFWQAEERYGRDD